MEWLRKRYLQIMSLTRNQLLNGQTLRRRISSQKSDIFIQNWNGQSWHGQSLATIFVDAQGTQLQTFPDSCYPSSAAAAPTASAPSSSSALPSPAKAVALYRRPRASYGNSRNSGWQGFCSGFRWLTLGLHKGEQDRRQAAPQPPGLPPAPRMEDGCQSPSYAQRFTKPARHGQMKGL